MIKMSAMVLGLMMSTAALGQSTKDFELRGLNWELNAIYQTLMRQLSPADQTRLRKAQRAWLVFRDADCSGRTETCLIDRTDARLRQLRLSRYFDAAGEHIILPRYPGTVTYDDCPN